MYNAQGRQGCIWGGNEFVPYFGSTNSGRANKDMQQKCGIHPESLLS